MKDLIETIEAIGFREICIDFGAKVFERENWLIIMHERHWELACQNLQSLTPVSVAHTLIPFDDRKILSKYFSSELREERLKRIGI
jgi:hypothetical protein